MAARKPYTPPYTPQEAAQIKIWQVQALNGNANAQNILKSLEINTMLYVTVEGYKKEKANFDAKIQEKLNQQVTDETPTQEENADPTDVLSGSDSTGIKPGFSPVLILAGVGILALIVILLVNRN